jgi:hypothetical protein
MVTMQPSDKGGPCMHVGSRVKSRALPWIRDGERFRDGENYLGLR